MQLDEIPPPLPEPIEESGLSIGALAKATGIGIHSLRMWERRYGSPKSYRRDSGHRRYPPSEVPRLRAVARALNLGHRAGEVVGRDIAELDVLLKEQARRGACDELPTNQEIIDSLNACIEAACLFDGVELRALLQAAWDRTDPIRFLEDYIGPFLYLVGEGWQSGNIHVSQEHFASEQTAAFLADKWKAATPDPGAPLFVLATPPGEQHQLGLHMAALAAVSSGARLLYLGSQVPAEEVRHAVKCSNAAGACISFSRFTQKSYCLAYLAELRGLLPASIAIYAGGHGAHAVPGVVRPPRLADFCAQLRAIEVA